MKTAWTWLVFALAGLALAQLLNAAEADNKRWAFQAPVRPAVPTVQNLRWGRNPIDNFILAKLEKEKLAPSTLR